MTELVPFQDKRKKQFPESTTAYQAVESELKKYFTNQYPVLEFGKEVLALDNEANTLDKQTITNLPTFESFSEIVARVTSPELIEDPSLKWDLARLEVPMLLMRLTAKDITKKPYLVLPKPYQKILKRVYSSSETYEKLSAFLSSKKRAKKYLRILQKRLGIFSERKPPFKKANPGAHLI